MPYFATDGSGSVEVPIVLQNVDVSGAVFIGNMAVMITASMLADSSTVSGSSSFPIAQTGLNYWDGSTWQHVTGNSGSLMVEISGAGGGVIPVEISSSAVNPVWVSGVLLVQDPELPYPSASISLFTASLTSALFSDTNPNRKQLMIYNNTNSELYIAFADHAHVTTDFTLMMPATSYYELPTTNGVYSGPIAGIWEFTSARGTASLTEISG